MQQSGIPYLIGKHGAPAAPVPDYQPGNWTIQQFQFPLAWGLAGHHGFALLNPAGKVVHEMQGLATDPQGNIIAIGTFGDKLKVYAFPGSNVYARASATCTVASGPYSNVVESIWGAAMAGAAAINAQKLAYPFLGFGANSNSVATTLATCMNAREPAKVVRASLYVPGQGALLLPISEIKNIQRACGLTATVAGSTWPSHVLPKPPTAEPPALQGTNKLQRIRNQVQAFQIELRHQIETLTTIRNARDTTYGTQLRIDALLQGTYTASARWSALSDALDASLQVFEETITDPVIQAWVSEGVSAVEPIAMSDARAINSAFLKQHALAAQTRAPRLAPPVTDYQSAYYASWVQQASLFQMGEPMGGDRHRRRVRFADGSYAVVQAYQPITTRSDQSKLRLSLATFLGSIVGLMGTALAQNAGTDSALYPPNDATWQAYEINYYTQDGAATPWGTRYIYGWQQSASIHQAITLDGQSNPELFFDFADSPQEFTWYRWRTGSAQPRVMASLPNTSSSAAAPLAEPLATAAALVQAAASCGDTQAGACPYMPSPSMAAGAAPLWAALPERHSSLG